MDEKWTPALVNSICTVITGFIAWALVRIVKQNDRHGERIDDHGERLAVVETVLQQQGLLDSPTVKMQKRGGA